MTWAARPRLVQIARPGGRWVGGWPGRDESISAINGTGAELALHQAAFELAAKTCRQYADTLRALQSRHRALSGHAEHLERTIHAVNAASAAGQPPEPTQVLAISAEKGRIRGEHSALMAQARAAAETAAGGFAQAAVMNVQDLRYLAAHRGQSGSSLVGHLLPGVPPSVALVAAPRMTTLATETLSRAAIQGAMIETGTATLATGTGEAFAGRALLAGLGTRVVGAVPGALAIVLTEKSPAGGIGDTYDTMYVNGALVAAPVLAKVGGDGPTIQMPEREPDWVRLFEDQDGPEPEPDGAGALLPPDCTDPRDGGWHTPPGGEWVPVNHGWLHHETGQMRIAWPFQEQVTHIDRHFELEINGVKIEGYATDHSGHHIFADAKGKGNLKALSAYKWKVTSATDQLSRQLTAIHDVPNHRLVHVYQEPDAIKKLLDAIKAKDPRIDIDVQEQLKDALADGTLKFTQQEMDWSNKSGC